MLALPIFPGRLQPSIVSRSELNFRVRDGNGWTLALINTNLLSFEKKHYNSFSKDCVSRETPRARALKTEQRKEAKSKARTLPANCRSSPRAISTGQLHALLRFHLLPIDQVVFLGPYSIKDERSHLGGCFTLRCLQRLSRPYLATQLCRWHDNWCTRGTSIPVLSY